MQSNEFSHFHIPIKLQGRFKSTNSAAMIDSGATGLFLHQWFVNRHQMLTQPLSHPITLYNIDRTPNTAGKITHSIQLLATIDQNSPQLLEYLVTNIGSEDIILGLPWLQKVNPDINWKKGCLTIPPLAPHSITIEDVPEPKTSNVGGTSVDRVMELNPKYIRLPDPDTEELCRWEEDN